MKGTLVILEGPGQIAFREYDVPDPEPGAIVAEVIRSNICGSELHILRGHHPSVRFGSVLGHETLLRVVRLGSGVETDFAGQPLKEGDRITCTYFQICRKCAACQIGKWNLCLNAYRHWSRPADTPPHFHGTFATHYYVYPDQYTYKVPEGVPDGAAASANCALSQMLFGLEEAKVAAGETVLIQGVGGLGLCGIAVAKERGARVLAIDGVASRLEQARRFGADEVLDFNVHNTPEARQEQVLALTGGIGPDVVVDVTGVPDVFAEGPHLARPGGRFVEIGSISPGHTTTFDPGLLTRRSVTIIPVLRYYPWFLWRALEFLAQHPERYPFHQLLDGEYPLSEAEQALRDSAERRVTRASLLPNRTG